MTDASAHWPRTILDFIYYVTAISFFVYLFVYFWTSAGGPTLLALTLVPFGLV